MSMENRSIPVAVSRGRAEPTAPGAQDSTAAGSSSPPRVVFTPLIDIHEGADGLVLEADLPGAREDRVTIELEDNVLSLHATIPSAVPEGTRMLHEEYRDGDFYRSFILSDEVDRGRITAELKNGVLRITLPKAEHARTHRIEIKTP
jgi:HSP20 family molecular chaperone IbpA